jgi:hypothetical protein
MTGASTAVLEPTEQGVGEHDLMVPILYGLPVRLAIE